MAAITYHIKIKKEYASAILEDLQQIDAIEIVESEIPEWQQKETLKRLKAIKSNPTSGLSEDDFFKQVEGGEEKI